MKRRKEAADGGFTLLEVVLAVAILGLLLVPLLNYFGQSVKYNALMERQQSATLLAQDVTETIKAQETLISTDAAGNYVVSCLDSLGYTKDADTMDADGIGALTYSVTSGNYDVVVTAETTQKTSTASSDSNYFGIDGSTDLLAVDTGVDTAALNYFIGVNSGAAAVDASYGGLSESEIQSKMKREIVLDFAWTGTGNGAVANVTYQYTCDGISAQTASYTYLLLEDETIGTLNNFYLMYHALEDTDTITVTSNLPTEPALYLICLNYDASTMGSYAVEITGLSAATVHTNLEGTMIKNVSTSGYYTVEALTDTIEDLRTVDVTVEVYKKGETATGEPYITVDATKGE